jgi:hypothetical protein
LTLEQDQKDVPDNDSLCSSGCSFNIYHYLCSVRRSLVLECSTWGGHNDGDGGPPDESAFGIARGIVIAFLLAWIIIGIRQWFVLSKWTQRYEIYKELQKKIDEKLDYESKENNNEEEEKVER